MTLKFQQGLRTKFLSIYDVTVFSNELKKLIEELKKSGINACIKLKET